uniref:Transposase n=1 Tax=Brugia timori TaxID=42155 RepID=A0A0R3R3H7_9BILA
LAFTLATLMATYDQNLLKTSAIFKFSDITSNI